MRLLAEAVLKRINKIYNSRNSMRLLALQNGEIEKAKIYNSRNSMRLLALEVTEGEGFQSTIVEIQ